MKALVYLGPRAMELQETPDPEPGPGEVVIRSRLSAICGSDLHGFREASPRRIPPLIMGHETVGAIDAVGDGVDPSRVGERVVLMPIVACGACARCREGRINLCANGKLIGRDLIGGFAERFSVPVASAVSLPDVIPEDLAVLTEPFANAVHVARRSVAEGDRVFVIGAGPIGVLRTRAAILRGATRVLITDPVVARLRFAEAQGAVAIDGGDPVAAVLDATDGEGADVVIDAAGFEATWALGVRTARPGARIVAVGLGAPAGTLDYFAVLGKELTISGSYAWTEVDFARSLALLGEGALDPAGWLTRVPLDQGQRAFEELVEGADRFKVLLEV